MKKLSFWAKANPKQSRVMIALAHVFTGVNALVLGGLFYFGDFDVSRWPLLIFANIFFFFFFLYPLKEQASGLFRNSYLKRKTLDFLLVFSAGMTLAFGVNHFLSVSEPLLQLPEGKAKLIVHKTIPEKELKSDFSVKKELRQKSRQLRQNIKAEIKELKREFKKQHNEDGRDNLIKALLIILTITVAVTLGFLVAALSCNLSCSGYEGLAVVTLILGWGGIVWLGIIAIKNILRKVGQGRKNPSADPLG